MEKVASNFFTYDFKRDVLGFRPELEFISFSIPEEDDPPTPKVRTYYMKNEAEKIRWIAGFLTHNKKPAEMYFKFHLRNIVTFSIVLEAEDFPVHEFALGFKLEKILEKGIDEMKINVLSDGIFKIDDNDLFTLFQNDFSCDMTIGSLRPSGQVLEDSIVDLPVEIIRTSV